MSSFTQFDGELYIVYSEEASNVLMDEYWVVLKSFTYYLDPNDLTRYVRVPVGFLSEGNSIPAPARILIPKMGKHSQAAFLHDYLCETYYITKLVEGEEFKERVSRKELDFIFFEALKVSGIVSWKRSIIELGVNLHRWIFRPTRPRIALGKTGMERKIREKLLQEI